MLAPAYGQDQLEGVRQRLDLLVQTDPAFSSEVDLSVGNMPIGDLLRNVAKASNVSIGFVGDGSMTVNCNLNRARIDDIIYYLCSQYDLDIDVVGNIVSVFSRQQEAEIFEPKVTYDRDSSFLSYDLKNISLEQASRAIADISGINIIYPQPLAAKEVSGYMVGVSAEAGLLALAESNGMRAFSDTPNVWNFEPADPEAGAASYTFTRRITEEQLIVDSTGLITVQVQSASINDIIRTVCQELGLNYYFISPVDGQTSLYLKNVGLHTLFKVLFTGTNYSYYEEEGIFMFGASAEQVLSSVKVVRMHNRTISRIMEVIPEYIREGVRVQLFGDLNSLVLSGDQRSVARVEQFLKSIDQTVPLVTIEVIIVDSKKSRKNEQGLSLGIGSEASVTGGQFSPGVNMDLSASAINRLLNHVSGFASVNLGKVGPNFYANLQMLEGTGNITLESTPKLSTLNGREAELTSGERRFYKEVNESLMGSQNPIQTSSYVWKSIDANLTVKIVPFVSGNEEITLTINIEQTEFTTKEEETAPPGTSTRSFKSEIRVQNEEMVLLGGIERNVQEKSSSGLPFIARIPILKWIFGRSVDNKEAHKLNVFIKPTVVY